MRLFLCSLALGFMGAQTALADYLVFVGTYTGAKSKGIYAYRMSDAGKLDPVGLVAETPSPSFLAIHPNGKYLYAANEVSSFKGEKTGAITAFSIDSKTGTLTKLNEQSSRGAGPCHITVDKKGKFVFVANYGGGNAAVLPIQKDGTVGKATGFVQHTGSSVNQGRQKEPHAHSINLDADNRRAFVADLGVDKVLVYNIGTNGELEPAGEAKTPAGAGPRHFAFHPNGKFAYVINELVSTVQAFGYDKKTGRLSTIQTISSLPDGFKGNNSTAEVQVHPNGKFVYGSNRGHDSIAAYSVNQKTGELTLVEHEPILGKTPRNFGIHPDGKFLLAAGQSSDSIAVFKIDEKTGALEFTGEKVVTPTPVCIKFLKVR